MYFTAIDETYIIDVDPITGVHTVRIDPKYRYTTDQRADSLRQTRQSGPDTEDNGSGASNLTDTEKEYRYETKEAKAFNTFVNLLHPDTFLVIKNVQNRLVITLPNDIHRLKITRFYMVLHGVGNAISNETLGNLFFRQDQPHIDLFVFFSVFFSNFFLFLAICVMLWKLKQAVDARQTRQRRQQEMQHMASRPFAKTDIVIDPDLPELGPPSDIQPLMGAAAALTGRKGAAGMLPKLSSKYSLNSSTMEATSPCGEDNFQLKPLAVEPTDDCVAAISTVFIQLPGGTCAPVKGCLGSALVQGSRVLNVPAQANSKQGVYIRRRPSTSA